MGGISIARQIERWKGDWSKFRDVEFKVLEKLQSAEDCMIDCGGGILFDWNENKEEILSERKWNLLKKMGKIIYLSRPLPFLVSKVKNDSERPSLSDEKAYAEVLSRRLPFYETHCDVKIDLGYLNKVDSIKKISAYL
jgi:shikimate kinase